MCLFLFEVGIFTASTTRIPGCSVPMLFWVMFPFVWFHVTGMSLVCVFAGTLPLRSNNTHNRSRNSESNGMRRVSIVSTVTGCNVCC